MEFLARIRRKMAESINQIDVPRLLLSLSRALVLPAMVSLYSTNQLRPMHNTPWVTQNFANSAKKG